MVDYFQKATEYVHHQFGEQYVVLEQIMNNNQFYCFTFQSKAFAQTRDFSQMAVGQGYFLISKEDERFFSFPSSLLAEQALTILERQLALEARIRRSKPAFDLQKQYDIRINTLAKRFVVIDKLHAHNVTYIIPEIVGDSIFRIPKPYDKKLLEKRLSELPATFHGLHDGLSVIHELLTSDACDFDITQHEKRSFAKYAAKASEEDLRPVW